MGPVDARVGHQSLVGHRPNDAGHQLGRPARGLRGEARDRFDELEHVAIIEAIEQVEQPEHGVVGDAIEQLERPFELTWLELRDESNGTVEQSNEHDERRQPLLERREFRVVGVLGGRIGGLAGLLLEHSDDGIALPDLALGDDPAEPLPVIVDREERRTRRTAPTDAPGLRDALHEPPAFRLAESQACRTVRQPERLADLALGERLLARHQVRLDAGDRRGHAPRRAHLTPGVGELEADRFGGRALRGAAVRFLRLDSSEFLGHNLLCKSSTLLTRFSPLKVAIVGGSGLVGRALTRSLIADGHDVLVLSRDPGRQAKRVMPPARIARWSKDDVEGLARALDGVDSVVSVAGARVAPWRWTRRRKQTITSSRVDSIKAIVDAMNRLPTDRRPSSLVVVSGIDAYPETPPGEDPTPFTESSPMGDDFLSRVSKGLEDEARRAESLGVRVARLRQGHVLARDADLVWFLALPIRLFFGGRLGTGRQWMSWVHIDDAIALFRRAIDGVDGVLNVTSPGACRQIDFVRAVARRVRRPVWFPAPAWLVKLVLGEQAVLLLGSRRVAPARALDDLGYEFRYPSLDQAIDDVLG